MKVDGRVRIDNTIFADAFTFLQSHGDDGRPQAHHPLAEHGALPRRRGRDRPAVYPDMEEFWDDLSAAYAEEIRRLGELGCTYLQLDDTSLAYLNDPAQRQMIAERGDDAEHQHLRYIRQINAALATRPDGHGDDDAHVPRQLPVRTGPPRAATTSSPRPSSANSTSTGSSSNTTTSAPAASSRCASCPKGKMVVLGLVTTKRGELESKDELKRRIDEAAKYVPLDQLCLSPQCGFSSTVEGNSLTFDEEVAKLRLVVETAHEVWG